ncbi:MAG: efflux RND transporter periplasmic adaptor subunit [Pseudomonadota bacterium]
MNLKRFVHLCFSSAALALLLTNLGCTKEKPFEKPKIPVKTHVVEAALPAAGLKYSAGLVPREQVDIAFKVGGYVEDILQIVGPDGKLRDVQKGDLVKKGEVLIRIRESDYLAKLNHAKSALEEAKASLSQASREFDRAERLFQGSVLAKNEFDKAREKLDVIRARVNGAASQVEEAQLQLQDTVLKAPLDALVAARFVERGSLVASGTRGLVLADLSSVKAVFGVPDYILTQVTPGAGLTVTVEALENKEFKGIITSVSPSADPKSRVFEVETTIPNPGFQLKDGMIATVEVKGAAAESALPVVPLNAVVRPPDDAQGYMVYVLEDVQGKPRAGGRKVGIGKVFANKVTITSGLNVGERIITRGATLVYEGAEVTLTP